MNNRVSRSRRKRNKSKLPFITFILLTILLVVTSVFVFTNIEDIFKQKEPQIVVKTDSKNIADGVTLETESKESNSFTSYIAYPLTNIDSIDETIKEWVTSEETNFYTEMEQIELLLGEEFKAHFSIQTTVDTIGEKIMSFVLEAEQTLEADNTYKTIQTYIVDLKNEQFITLDQIIDQSSFTKDDWYMLLKEHTAETIDETSVKNGFSDIAKIKWTVNKKEIVLHYNPSELGSNSKIIQINIPIIAIYENIKNQYQSLIITEEIQIEIDKIIEEQKRLEEEKKKAEEEEKKKLEEEKKQQEANSNTNNNSSSKPKYELPNDGKKYIALTFDDGPHATVTPRVLNALREYNAKATFFMLGQNAEYYPALAKQVADEGHEIANHSISHANLKAISKDKIKNEMYHSIEQIEKATGKRPTLFRPPYGNYNDTVINYGKESNQKIIMWSVDTRDWESKNPSAINDIVKKYTKSGSIILLHDIHPTTADALPQMLKYLSDQGYEFITVSEMLQMVGASGVGPYSGF